MCLIQIDKLRMGVIDDEVEAEGLQEYLFGKEDASLALFHLLSCRKFRRGTDSNESFLPCYRLKFD